MAAKQALVSSAKQALVSAGRILFVGEGNLTYALEAITKLGVEPSKLVASVYEPREVALKKYQGMHKRVKHLEKVGVNVVFDVDATKLSTHPVIKDDSFDLIQWNFPHHATAASSKIKENQDLISGFFEQAQLVLREGGNVTVLLNTNFPFGEQKEKDAAAVDVGEEKDAAAVDVVEEKDAAAVDVVEKKDAAAVDVVEEKDAAAVDVVEKKDAAAVDVVEEKDAAAAVDVVEEKDAAAVDVVEKKDAAAGFDIEEYRKGWNIQSLAAKAGLKCVFYEDFEAGKHGIYKPIKGFGNDPDRKWGTGFALFYSFQLNPNLQSSKTESGRKLKDKCSQNK